MVCPTLVWGRPPEHPGPLYKMFILTSLQSIYVNFTDHNLDPCFLSLPDFEKSYHMITILDRFGWLPFFSRLKITSPNTR